LERKQRLQRQKQRQTTNGAAAPVTAPVNDLWPGLRSQFHAEIKQRHLSRGQVAKELGTSKSSIGSWLWPDGAPPSADNLDKIRRWLSSTPAPVDAPEPGPESDVEIPEPEAESDDMGAAAEDEPPPVPPYRLREDQRDQLAGYVQITDKRQLRADLGMSTEMIGMAVGGRELPLEALQRITAFLANGAAAE
jgi:transcriptional regulator with XRE-family HTH domain